MDDGWGNILYLIVAALFGIISMLKKKKQSKAVSPPDGDEDFQTDTPESTSGFESVLGTLLGMEESKPNVQPIEEPEPVHQESMMEEYNRREREKAEARNEAKKTTFTAQESILKESVDEIEMEEVIEEEKEEIDWRQAIIYKEILDRKYN